MRYRFLTGLVLLGACSEPPTTPSTADRVGSVAVVVSRGIAEFTDPDGYTLSVAGTNIPIPATGDSLQFDDLPAHSAFAATLSGLAHDCWVAQTTRSRLVVADTLLVLRFVVNCSTQYGELRVITQSFGLNFPSAGYQLTRDSLPSRIDVNDTLTLLGTPGAVETFQLLSGTPGCWTSDTGARTVSYPPAGQSTDIVFTVHCGVILFHAFPPNSPAQFFQVNVSTGEIRPLATMHTNAQGFRQSPDGRRVAFMAFNMTAGGNVELYTMTPMATEIHTVLTTPDTEDWPSWSADGQSLYFANYEHGDLRQLTLATRAVRVFPREADEETWPTPSPHGDRIAYQHIVNQFSEIWTMDTAGGTRAPAFPVRWNLVTPEWSPDGTRLVASGFNEPNADRVRTFVGAPGTVPVAVTSPGAQVSEGYPRWSPDGSQIAFIRILPDGTIRHLMLMRPDGSDLREIPIPYAWNGDYNWIR